MIGSHIITNTEKPLASPESVRSSRNTAIATRMKTVLIFTVTSRPVDDNARL